MKNLSYILKYPFCRLCFLPAGALIRGGGIKGTMIGRPPCSLEEEGFTDASAATPFRDVGVEPELLACGGEPLLFSTVDDFGKEFSREEREVMVSHLCITNQSQSEIHKVSGIYICCVKCHWWV